MTHDSPPLAHVDPAPSWSPIWIVPVIAALLAGALAFQSLDVLGTNIRVSFEQGYGIQVGDTLRYRGIVAGEVTGMSYTDEVDGVILDITLDTNADDLARVGSRFWVVRPLVGWAGITGLDTVIGNRYLGVIPGSGPPQRQFVGLDQPPIEDALMPGLDITLEGSTRGSIAPGSPVTYRRIQVGSVLSVSLASDSRNVEVLARIREKYAALIQNGTRFWETSGVGVDVGITGASFHLESLESLVHGGVSLAVPQGEQEQVSTGHRFTLHTHPEDSWLTWRPSVPIGNSLLPPGSPVPHPERAQLSWIEGTLWSADEVREGWALPIRGAILAPADILSQDQAADAGSSLLQVAGLELPLEEPATEAGPGLSTRPFPGGADVQPWPRARQRVPAGPEDCVVLTDPGSPPLSLAPGGLERKDDGWHIDRALPLDARWHGAPVLARKDGLLIGLVLVEEKGSRIVPLTRLVP
ncbi:MAG: MlaD family protein [Planctomycetota bacterium]|jgi:paraquat-inducible protein B|nr:MlaD family protein [Planctomycetota bacterium]